MREALRGLVRIIEVGVSKIRGLESDSKNEGISVV